MKNLICKFGCLVTLCMLLGHVHAQNTNNLCINATPFCTDSITYPAGTDMSNAPDLPSNQRGCLYLCPAPAWHVLRIDNPGDLLISMRHSNGRDIDFACWGPFTGYASRSELLRAVCTSQLTSQGAAHHPTDCYHDSIDPSTWGGYPNDKLVDCCYSASSEECCYIPKAHTGEWYILMVTNYSREPGEIQFNIEAGAATLDYNVYADVYNNGPLFEGGNLQLTCTTYSSSGYRWTGPNGFTSTEQNPVISNATTANTGDYVVTFIPDGLNQEVTGTTHANIYPQITITLWGTYIYNDSFPFLHP